MTRNSLGVHIWGILRRKKKVELFVVAGGRAKGYVFHSVVFVTYYLAVSVEPLQENMKYSWPLPTLGAYVVPGVDGADPCKKTFRNHSVVYL